VAFRPGPPKHTEKPGCAELNGESDAIMIAAVMIDDLPVVVIEMKVSRQLFRSWFADIMAKASSLFLGQENTGHESTSILGGFAVIRGKGLK